MTRRERYGESGCSAGAHRYAENFSETEEMSGTDREIYILKLSLRYLEDELAQVRKRLAEIEEE